MLKRQNPNTNNRLNHVKWSRMPKTTFVGYTSLKIGVLGAVLSFNEGSMSRVKVFQELGVDPGTNKVSALRKNCYGKGSEGSKRCRIYHKGG